MSDKKRLEKKWRNEKRKWGGWDCLYLWNVFAIYCIYSNYICYMQLKSILRIKIHERIVILQH